MVLAVVLSIQLRGYRGRGRYPWKATELESREERVDSWNLSQNGVSDGRDLIALSGGRCELHARYEWQTHGRPRVHTLVWTKLQ